MAVKIRKVGRPKTQFDLNALKKICTLNCTMPEIASYLEIPLRTLEDRFKNDVKVREAINYGRDH